MLHCFNIRRSKTLQSFDCNICIALDSFFNCGNCATGQGATAGNLEYNGGGEMKQVNLKDEQGIVHAKGCTQADYTLCGVSTDQCISDVEDWGEMEETYDRITCKDCIRIIKYAKKLKI